MLRRPPSLFIESSSQQILGRRKNLGLDAPEKTVNAEMVDERPDERPYSRMRRPDRFVWLLIGAVALAASVCGHALELAIENLRVLGDGRANYAHPAQLFAGEMAGALFLIALVAMARRFLQCALHARADKDCLVPALGGIVRFGFAPVTVSLLLIQFASLISSELLEQHWAGFGGGLASIIGPGHITTIAVHLVVGMLFAFCLYRVSRFVCAQTKTIVSVIALFARRLVPATPKPISSYSQRTLLVCARRPALLALGLANRPPPFSFANA